MILLADMPWYNIVLYINYIFWGVIAGIEILFLSSQWGHVSVGEFPSEIKRWKNATNTVIFISILPVVISILVTGNVFLFIGLFLLQLLLSWGLYLLGRYLS